MTSIEKALVVREPWIDLILSGQKTWEMRGQRPSYRGWLGLIRKGSGHVACIGRLVDVGQTLSEDEMVAAFGYHRIPEAMIRNGEVAKWTIPWKLADIHVLHQPVPYRHPNGAITLFSLDPNVSAAITAQLGELPLNEAIQPLPNIASPQPVSCPSPARPLAPKAEGKLFTSPLSHTTGSLLGEVEVTEANLKYNHFYLRSFLHHLPEDLVGGRDRSTPIMATVQADGMPPSSTDICPRHRFFRDRSWTRQFFANSDAEPGDTVSIHQLEPYHYKISLNKKARI
tara:strand:+ start:117 stop:968 length:852 start_codon:yes stop_codon:yes gene_type:complete